MAAAAASSSGAAMHAAAPPSAAGGGDPLAAMYTDMAAEFAEQGLDVDGIRGLLGYFDNVEEDSSSGGSGGGGGASKAVQLPWPKRYSSFSPPLPPGGARLVVAPLAGAPALAGLGARATAAFVALLPPGTKVTADGRGAALAAVVARAAGGRRSHLLIPLITAHRLPSLPKPRPALPALPHAPRYSSTAAPTTM
jgi:hypothetical protein